ncbi:HSP20-like chaperone [Auriscalpium vulgare]|uniref:HSP20-like chaperone n=1 Tax=Auriscalpium vulgare TaxID=40419 RepID=A0ACB8RND6_9AGAM|nr:HSP20-like chaperone [Auriscalpium vulgare]
MSLTFYEPFYSLSEFDRLFDDALTARTNGRGQRRVQNGSTGSIGLRPRLDVHENKDTNTVTASFELPGLKKEDVQIDVHNNVLTVSAESKVDTERNEDAYAVRERRYGRFSRSVQLPQGISDEEIKATMENGVLTVTYPHSAPELAPKKIAIA